MSLYQHQILYAAVGKCQRAEERNGVIAGVMSDKLLSLYRGLAGVLTLEQEENEDETVSEEILSVLQESLVSTRNSTNSA